MPATITNALVQGARVWSSIQFYHLVNGSRQKGNLTWDCTSSNPAYHWTSRGEFYCESDLTRAISKALAQLAAGSFPFVDPGPVPRSQAAGSRPGRCDLRFAGWRGVTFTYRATSLGRWP